MQPNILLKDYTTMHLGGSSRYLATARTREELLQYIHSAESQNIPLLILGDGSNLIVGDQGFPGLTILNRIPGFDIVSQSPTATRITIGAGESWDVAVQRTTDVTLSGIEALSGIPGRVGAAPVQNIGAYGQEIADVLTDVEVYDTMTKKIVTLSNSDCNFSYRRSIFNSTAKRRYIVLSITIELVPLQLEPPFYASLQNYLDSQNITDYSPASLRQAVLQLRSTKLPNPAILANAGSFFKNPIIEQWEVDNLKKQYTDLPLYGMGDDTYKISAGWLIEQAGLKGYSQNGIKVYDKNALVLVNESATSYQDLAAMREFIVDKVRDMFRINLEQEPEEVGA